MSGDVGGFILRLQPLSGRPAAGCEDNVQTKWNRAQWLCLLIQLFSDRTNKLQRF